MKLTNILLPAALAAALSGLAQARPHHPPPGPVAQLVQRQGDQLTLSQERGWHKDVWLDSDTSYYEGRELDPGVRERLAPGDFLDVRDRLEADGQWHVKELHRHRGRPVHGRVVAVNAAGFLLESHGEPVQVDVSDSTDYRFGWLPGSKSTIMVDRPAAVEGKQVGPNRVEASEVNVPFPWMALGAGLGLSCLVAGVAWRRRRTLKRPRVDD